jgi:metal-dependent amidase/aminoacylase/carboxypeptidase family protein
MLVAIKTTSGSQDLSRFTNVISGCFVFVNGDDADDGRPDMNCHPRFNLLQSSFAAEVKTNVRIVLDMASVG